METLERVLEQHGFFNDLEQEYLKLLVRCASNVRFDAGVYLFREGQEVTQAELRCGTTSFDKRLRRADNRMVHSDTRPC